jgi:FkbM family methyltransferase
MRLVMAAIGAAVVFMAISVALAPHWEPAWIASFQVVAFFRRLAAFPEAVRDRDPRCSVGKAWSASSASEQVLIVRRLKRETRQGRLDNGIRLMETPFGNYWIPERDTATFFTELSEQGTNIYDYAGRGVQPGDVVLDCGANVGVYTRHALERGAKLVVAIEPAPESLECLRRTFQKETGAGRVIIYPKGVWDKDDELEMSISAAFASTAASVALDRGGRGVKVPLTTIDKLVEELKLERVDFIKMDIEGAERQALQGALQTVARFRPGMAIALEHTPSDPDEIPALVQQLWPRYSLEFGRCVVADGRLRPDILMAH